MLAKARGRLQTNFSDCEVQNIDWIFIFTNDGIIETAFPPWDIDSYIERRGFKLVGKIREVLR